MERFIAYLRPWRASSIQVASIDANHEDAALQQLRQVYPHHFVLALVILPVVQPMPHRWKDNKP